VIIVSKGMDPDSDSYSAFQAVDSKGVPLAALLRARGVERVFVGGLATDYCVKHTVLDAIGHGLEVVLLQDAIRAVELHPGDSSRAIEEMVHAGASVEGLRALDG
jgi:nicotinamidase/pyrazinamidase